MQKKIVKITSMVLLLFIGLAFAAPLLFKGKIREIAKKEIAKNINAKVDFKDLDISLFRHFPNASVALEEISIVGLDNFAKDTLISAKKIEVAIGLFSLFGNTLKVSGVFIDEPRIHLLVNDKGVANWNITKPDTSKLTSNEASSFKTQLSKYRISNGYLYYKDASANMSSEIVGLDHEGSGDISADLFTLSTSSHAKAVSFSYAGIPYLASVETNIKADIEVDNKNSKYSFKTDDISLNEMKLSTSGFFQFLNDTTYNMDILFKTPSNNFKTILSLVPVIYQKDFEKIKTDGKASFSGFVKGQYNSVKVPSYNVDLKVENAFFQYPDLPKPVKNINIAANLSNPDGVMDHTVVNISQAHLEMDNAPFDMKLLLKKPMTSRYIDASLKGRLDLAQITQFVKLQEGTKLSGALHADIAAIGDLAVIQKQVPGEFSAKGFVDISNLNYSSKEFPRPIRNTSVKLIAENPDGITDHTVIQITSSHIEIGNDPINFTLLLKNPATDPYFDGTVKGTFNLDGLSQFYQLPAATTLSGLLSADAAFKGRKSSIDKKQYQSIALSGALQGSNIKYTSKDYPEGVALNNARLTFNPQNVTLSALNGIFAGTKFNGDGSINNLLGYALKDEPISGTLNLSADKIDLNKWLGISSTTAKDSSTTGAFIVPANLDVTFNIKADLLHYDKVDYRNIMGSLVVKDETVFLKNVKMDALDGTVAVNGTYSTKHDKKNPDISLSYDVQNLDVQKTFYAYNSIQQLMPIGKFISGKLSSKMNMKGKLSSNMMPDMSSLTGQGDLLLLQGFLSKFKPLESLSSTLNVKELEQISVKDIKNYFEFANGKVLVKPFNVKVKDIDMEIGGMHGLDQSLDYVINMKLPRSYLGTQGNQLINNLAAEASSKGIPVNVGETVNLKVNMKGSMTNPSIKTDLKNSAGNLANDLKEQTQQFAEEKKAAVRDTLKSIKETALKSAGDLLKEALTDKKDTTQKANDTKKNIEQSAKGLLDNFNPFKKKAKTTDSTKNNR
jgi:hypothetical protein